MVKICTISWITLYTVYVQNPQRHYMCIIANLRTRVSDHKRLVIFTFTTGAVVNCIAHVNEKAGSLREHLFPCSGRKNESHWDQWTRGIFVPLGFVCVYCCYSDQLKELKPCSQVLVGRLLYQLLHFLLSIETWKKTRQFQVALMRDPIIMAKR